jgi:hypothetical protein
MNKQTKDTITGHIIVSGAFLMIPTTFAILCWIMGV